MFETATFESAGQITTQSRRWMMATLLLNASIVAGLIVIPLMHPELLPGHTWTSLLAPPVAPSVPPAAHAPVQTMRTVDLADPFQPPRVIPTSISHDAGPQPVGNVDLRAMENGSGSVTGADNVFGDHAAVRVVHAVQAGPVRVSSRLLEGQIIYKRQPVYPAIAKAAGIEGTVILQAAISKAGTIENLRVVNGPEMLRQAALDAVSQWRYRPYVLNGQPVEVETTVNVVFNLSH